MQIETDVIRGRTDKNGAGQNDLPLDFINFYFARVMPATGTVALIF